MFRIGSNSTVNSIPRNASATTAAISQVEPDEDA